MESLPAGNECPPVRVTPLPIALYESNGLLFELYDGGQPFEPTVIRWERLKPVIRKVTSTQTKRSGAERCSKQIR